MNAFRIDVPLNISSIGVLDMISGDSRSVLFPVFFSPLRVSTGEALVHGAGMRF